MMSEHDKKGILKGHRKRIKKAFRAECKHKFRSYTEWKAYFDKYIFPLYEQHEAAFIQLFGQAKSLYHYKLWVQDNVDCAPGVEFFRYRAV